MKAALLKIFRRVPLRDVLADQLFEAERLHCEHMAAAELHAGLAGVYRARIERVRRELAPMTAKLQVAK
ncbi:MAG: hypothetical protein JWQ72_2352 [Polaromonas sp.]|nr:hypothetical protein [Polaromonas sp.]